MFILEKDKYYEDFNKAIKIFNSQWEPNDIVEVVNAKGEHFLAVSINTSYSWNPTKEDCEAIAEYLKVTYRKGYFYKRIYLN